MKYIKTIETDYAFLGLGDDDIIYLYMKDYFILDIPMQNWLIIAYRYFCEDQMYPMVTEAGAFVEYKKEVMPFLNEIIDELPILSNSLLVKTMGHRLVASFFTKFVEPPIPLKIFTNKEKAVLWAKEHWAKYLDSLST